MEGNFTVSLLNVVEDLDGDGVEDFYDSDDDGDGYSDAEEVAYGSDPRDAASVANAQPVGLSAQWEDCKLWRTNQLALWLEY